MDNQNCLPAERLNRPYRQAYRSPRTFRERATANIASTSSHRAVSVRSDIASAPALQIGIAIILAAFVLLAATITNAESLADSLAKRKPEATIDLATKAGTELVKGQWRYSDTKIVEIDFKAAGPDGQPGTTPNRAYDFTPHAGRADFDDSRWQVIEPATLDRRRSAGKLAFNWYRLKITVPERIGTFDTTGSTLVFSTTLDDYAEIWVDSELHAPQAKAAVR